MKLQHGVFWVGGIVLVIVFLQNTQVVSLQFLFWKLSMSRIILLPVVLLVGFVVGFCREEVVGLVRKEN